MRASGGPAAAARQGRPDAELFRDRRRRLRSGDIRFVGRTRRAPRAACGSRLVRPLHRKSQRASAAAPACAEADGSRRLRPRRMRLRACVRGRRLRPRFVKRAQKRLAGAVESSPFGCPRRASAARGALRRVQARSAVRGVRALSATTQFRPLALASYRRSSTRLKSSAPVSFGRSFATPNETVTLPHVLAVGLDRPLLGFEHPADPFGRFDGVVRGWRPAA